MNPALYLTDTLSRIFIVLAHWSNRPQEDMSPHSDTLYWSQADQSLLLLLNAACFAEKQQIPILKSLVWPDRDSTSDFPHARRARYPLHHRRGWNCTQNAPYTGTMYLYEHVQYAGPKLNLHKRQKTNKQKNKTNILWIHYISSDTNFRGFRGCSQTTNLNIQWNVYFALLYYCRIVKQRNSVSSKRYILANPRK